MTQGSCEIDQTIKRTRRWNAMKVGRTQMFPQGEGRRIVEVFLVRKTKHVRGADMNDSGKMTMTDAVPSVVRKMCASVLATYEFKVSKILFLHPSTRPLVCPLFFNDTQFSYPSLYSVLFISMGLF